MSQPAACPNFPKTGHKFETMITTTIRLGCVSAFPRTLQNSCNVAWPCLQELVSSLEAQLKQAKEDVSSHQAQATGLAASVGAQLEEIRSCLAQERGQHAETQV